MNTDKLKEQLMQYGKVEQCEVNKEGFFAVKITEGFSDNAVKTFEVMKVITEAVGDVYPIVKKCVTDKNMFDFQLRKP